MADYLFPLNTQANPLVCFNGKCERKRKPSWKVSLYLHKEVKVFLVWLGEERPWSRERHLMQTFKKVRVLKTPYLLFLWSLMWQTSIQHFWEAHMTCHFLISACSSFEAEALHIVASDTFTLNHMLFKHFYILKVLCYPHIWTFNLQYLSDLCSAADIWSIGLFSSFI